MKQDTLKLAKNPLCNCKPEDRLQRPTCCFMCRYCGKRIRQQFIKQHEENCEKRYAIDVIGLEPQDES